VVHALTEIAPRWPDLVVSGINSGANLSTEVTISGTVGAALEAAAFGLPALAVSLEMDARFHLTGDPSANYEAVIAHTRTWAARLLQRPLPQGWQVLNVNVPATAKVETPWRATRLSLRRYFEPTPPRRVNGEGRPGYVMIRHPEHSEPDSDVHAVLVDGVVSVTPLSLDMTAAGALQAEGWADAEPAMAPNYAWEAAS
jgi:5'-nucleotidase